MRSSLVAAASIALMVAGCGSSSSSPSAAIGGADAKAVVEHAAHVQLASMPVPKDAKGQGLLQAYSNAQTASGDKQIVFVFTLKDSDTVDKLRDQLAGSVPGPAQVITHENVLVVYGATGVDHAAAVKSTLTALR